MSPLLRRGLARLVDGLLLAVAGVAWGYPLSYDLVWLVAHALLVYAYFVVGDIAFGRTLGKAALGLRLDERPTLVQAAKRELFVLAGALPFVGPPIAMGLWGWFAYGIRNTGEGAHDRLAGTRVVDA
jgi:uncharacterized RDD family membrane protein YckC